MKILASMKGKRTVAVRLGEIIPGITQDGWTTTPPPEPPFLAGCFSANSDHLSAFSQPEFSAGE